MARIEDRRTPERDESGPYGPETTAGPGRSRSIDWAALSHAVVPAAIRHRAIDVTVSTDRDAYRPGDPVSIDVAFRNRFPIPIRLRTDSPNVWTWAVDGTTAASRLPRSIPDRDGTIAFAPFERKRFRRRWRQRIRTGDREWTPVEPGRHSIEARIARDDAADRGLVARTEIEIRD